MIGDVGRGVSQRISNGIGTWVRLAIVLIALLLEVARLGSLIFPEQFVDVLLAFGVLTTATTPLPHSRWLLLLLFLLAFGRSVEAVYPVASISERWEFPLCVSLGDTSRIPPASPRSLEPFVWASPINTGIPDGSC